MPILLRLRLPAALLSALVLASAPALAEQIEVRDLNSGRKSTIHAHEIVSETWSEVKYKERERSAAESVPTLTVEAVQRNDKSPNAEALRTAIGDLARGNLEEATRALHELSGGGWKTDHVDTGLRKYVSFDANDPSGRNKRPDWISEYAHFHYAKALFLSAEASNDGDLMKEASLALDDAPVPGGAEEQTSGGFLKRFEGGNSRFVPEAMALKGRALTALGRHDEAAQTFEALHQAAIQVPLRPRWTFEGLLGPGLIAEAKGDLTEAAMAYQGAIQTLEVYLGQEARGWMRQRYGELYSRARMRVAAVKLRDAEKRGAAAAFTDLRSWIQGGMPEALRDRGRAKGLPQESIDALVRGARAPAVQAVAGNGLGLAYLNEPAPKYEDAVLAFKAVTVKYFDEPEQHARALYYLAKAAAGAAKAAKGEAQAMYESMADRALRKLRQQHPESEWAKLR